PASAELTYRQGVCKHLRMVDGDCDTGDDEVLISRRSADAARVEVGDTLRTSGGGDADAASAEFTVAGIYEPVDAASGYWGLSSPFRHGTTDDGDRLDALFAT